MQRFSSPGYTDPVCRHMRSRTLLADIIYGGNQHGRWLNCRHCDVREAIQTLSLMSCVNCSLAHIHRPGDDPRKTCVWTRWLCMIGRCRFRMTDPEKAVIRERISRCQERRRMAAMGIPRPLEESQVSEDSPQPSESLTIPNCGSEHARKRDYLSSLCTPPKHILKNGHHPLQDQLKLLPER